MFNIPLKSGKDESNIQGYKTIAFTERTASTYGTIPG